MELYQEHFAKRNESCLVQFEALDKEGTDNISAPGDFFIYEKPETQFHRFRKKGEVTYAPIEGMDKFPTRKTTRIYSLQL